MKNGRGCRPRALRRRGYIPVSGSISPGEKEVLRRLKAEPRVGFVKLVPFALPPRFADVGDERRLALREVPLANVP